jgi:hypothetical protein
LRYIDVWESESDWERFREERVDTAVLGMMAAHGITPPTTRPPHHHVDIVDTWVGG